MPAFITLSTLVGGMNVQVNLDPIDNTIWGTWGTLYVEASGGGLTCVTNDFTVIVPEPCIYGNFVKTPSGPVAVGQLATTSIIISTSQTPSASCEGAVFVTDPQTYPSFITWDQNTNTLTVSPTLSDPID